MCTAVKRVLLEHQPRNTEQMIIRTRFWAQVPRCVILPQQHFVAQVAFYLWGRYQPFHYQMKDMGRGSSCGNAVWGCMLQLWHTVSFQPDLFSSSRNPPLNSLLEQSPGNRLPQVRYITISFPPGSSKVVISHLHIPPYYCLRLSLFRGLC